MPRVDHTSYNGGSLLIISLGQTSAQPNSTVPPLSVITHTGEGHCSISSITITSFFQLNRLLE